MAKIDTAHESQEKSTKSPHDFLQIGYTLLRESLSSYPHDDLKLLMKSNPLSDDIVQRVRWDLDAHARRYGVTHGITIPHDALEKVIQDITYIRREAVKNLKDRFTLEDAVIRFIEERFDTRSLRGYQDRIRKLDTADLRATLKNSSYQKMLETMGYSPVMKPVADVLHTLNVDPTRVSPETQGAIASFLGSGTIDTRALKELLSLARMNGTQQREFLEFFLPTISLQELKDLGLVNEQKIQEYQEKLYTSWLGHHPEIAWLSPDDQKMIRDEFLLQLTEQEAIIPTRDIEDDLVARFFDMSDEDKNPLIRKMASMIDEIYEEEQKTRNTINSFQAFTTAVESKMSPADRAKLHGNWTDFTPKNYLISERSSGIKKHWKIISTDAVDSYGKGGVMLRAYDDFGEYTAATSDMVFSYGEFVDVFLSELHSLDVNRLKITKDAEFLDVDEAYELNTLEDFVRAIDVLDPKNQSRGVNVGDVFSFSLKGKKEYARFVGINSMTRTVTIADMDGIELPPMSWIEFIRMCEEGEIKELHRMGPMSSPELFAKNSGLSVEWDAEKGMVYRKTIAGKAEKVQGFMHANGTKYAELIWERDKVQLIEFESKETNTFKKSKQFAPATPERVLHYLQEHEITEPIDKKPANHTEHDGHHNDHHHDHKTGFFGALLGARNINDLIKGGKMAWHMFEHMIEEKHEVHASEMLYKTFSRFLPEESSLRMHALMEFSRNVGKKIEEKMEYIKKGLSAGARRKEIAHILMQDPPKPFDLLAALIVTVEMSGHLYPDTHLQELQWDQYLWFKKICQALNLDYEAQLEKCKKKVFETNPESGDHPAETLLITRLFKSISETNPYIQAISGGAKFWKNVESWAAGQTKKGEEEATEQPTWQGRRAYFMAKLASNEPEISLGAFNKILAKDAGPEALGTAFVWTMSNLPWTVAPNISDKFALNMIDPSKGVSFHAVPFAKNRTEAQKYHKTVYSLVKVLYRQGKIPEDDFDNFKALCTHRDTNIYTSQKNFFASMLKFWDKYHHILHPILQGSDPTLLQLATTEDEQLDDKGMDSGDRANFEQYLNTWEMFSNISFRNEKVQKDMLDYGGYAFENNMIFGRHHDEHGKPTQYRSLDRTLRAISIDGRTGSMDASDEENLWRGTILPYIRSIRTNPAFTEHPEYQREQLRIIYEEILSFLAGKLTSHNKRENFDTYIRNSHQYFRDLKNLGFDTSFEAVFHKNEFGGGQNDFDTHFERSQESFFAGGRRGVSKVQEATMHDTYRAMGFGGRDASNDARQSEAV